MKTIKELKDDYFLNQRPIKVSNGHLHGFLKRDNDILMYEFGKMILNLRGFEK